MSRLSEQALLPAGLRDVLPPHAAHEARIVEALVADFGGQGYDRVKPPLIEFETSLLHGCGAPTGLAAFRLMDPVSQRMMCLRSDMTPQIARIALTRLGAVARPLRISYAGQVLRVKGSQMRPERQFGQVGAELIGSDLPRADAEVVVMAVRALCRLGVEKLSVDLGMPVLVPAVLDALNVPADARQNLREALDRKDTVVVRNTGGPAADILVALLNAAGRADQAMAALNAIDLPPAAAEARARLGQALDLIKAAAPNVALTIDAVENRGFEYHTGVTFAFFAHKVRGELGRGGRYMAGNGDGPVEPATGFTLFMDSILRALPAPHSPDRLFLPIGTTADQAKDLRSQGWITVNALADDDDEAAAKAQGCTHIWVAGQARPLMTDGEE